MVNSMISKTLSPENQFRFPCPIFKAETRIAACFVLRDAFWRGDRPTVRTGCQCALESGRCPIPNIVKRMVRTGDDPYHSSDPTHTGMLSIEDLEGVARVITLDKTIERYGPSPQERKLLLQANEDARNGVRVERKRTATAPRMQEMPLASNVTPTADDTIRAAQSGDLAAAISLEAS